MILADITLPWGHTDSGVGRDIFLHCVWEAPFLRLLEHDHY